MPRFPGFADVPGISFRYDGRSSAEFLEGWEAGRSSEEVPGGRVEHLRRLDPDGALEVAVHVRTFDGSPALDWVVEFENRGPGDTPVIEDILPMDVTVTVPGRERLLLHHANGSSCKADDFLPLTTDLPPGGRKALSPHGGRSSNGVLPFMNLERQGSGLVLAVGWTGQWVASFERGAESLRLAAGMERTRLRLHPGERIRTPRMLALPWEGDDPATGTNALRRLLMDHYLPRIDGELVMPPVAQCLQAYFYLTGEASERFEMKALPRAAELGCELYWVDACWYGVGKEWWEEVGSWEVNRERFPNGLRPVSDAAHEAGMKFILWFEPERARPDSTLRREHPEFLLASESDPSNYLLNLGIPEAREHVTDLVSRLISENGVDVYRQDFNFDPLPYWRSADEPEREGMTEIRHVEGLYAFWDELRRRHPGLWIDNCSSGGRRIDLEMLSRSLPLWPSDFSDICGLPFGQGLHVGNQCVNAGLARWVPLFGGGMWSFTPYGARSQIVGGFTFGFHVAPEDLPGDDVRSVVGHKDVLAKGRTLLDDDFPMREAKAAIDEWKSIRPFFLGEFRLLLPLTVSYHDWCAWQFHREDLGGGIAMFLRRHRSPFAAMEVGLKYVDPEAEYDVSLSAAFEEAPRRRVSGEELAHMSVSVPEAPGSCLLRYTRVD